MYKEKSNVANEEFNVQTKSKTNPITRIVLTGGPCAGKSSALARLTSLATKEGFDVYVAPESATLLFNSGVVVDWADSEANYNFQVALMRYACGCVHV